ncbi:MAG: sodium:panthothenate symporter [Lentisphaeria bacterium]|nr:sodium:panthothenate symporter [Lentisphaeria bacterium]
MNWVDWVIVIVPVTFVYCVGLYSRRYVRSVADFLSAGRCCGRYVINVGDIANSLSIIGIVATIEIYYNTGFAISFWQNLMLPLSVVLALTGFCHYRFRETKAMSLGQFLEMRYSRKFRIFAAALRSLSEIIANSIMPAIAARFFIYFLDLPRHIVIGNVKISMFVLVMVVCLAIAISIICMGGTLALIITDSLQGMILYPIMAVFVVFILMKFDWNDQIVKVLEDRVEGESFLDPFDIEKMRDFNVFALVLTLFSTIFHRASWIGAGYTTAARSPHESKMGGLLGAWRNGLNIMLEFLIAVMIITILCHSQFANNLARDIRRELCLKINGEPGLLQSDEMRSKLDAAVRAMPPISHVIGKDRPLSRTDNPDTRYLEPIHQALLEGDTATAKLDKIDRESQANSTFQQYRTLYQQLLISSSMRKLLPHGLMGMFFLLLVMAMISTDDTRIYSAALTVTQDVIMPLRKKEATPRQHVWILRITSICVGIFFVIASVFMAQLDYINLFVTLVCSMWMGGCGPVMIFGLYSRFGTTAGAWTSLLSGMFISLGTITIQRNWADMIYPFLRRNDLADGVGRFLEAVSKPFHPYIVWKMDEVKCPINSYEFYFMTMLITLALYVIVSYATCKKPFNLERMLHRGKYNLDGENKTREPWTLRNVFSKLIGITPEYTAGDKVIAWAFFLYSFVYQFILTFLVVLIWNLFSPWPLDWWGKYYFILQLCVPGALAAITTVWFGIGGARDIIRLFRDLEHRVINHLDNGQVEGHVSLADKAQLEALDADESAGES